MNVKGIIWVGSLANDPHEAMRFFTDVLGMSLVTDSPGFARVAASNGDRLEFFGPDSTEHDQLDTGPVAGLWVDDAASARDELVAAGVEAITALETGPDGHSWFYFKGPDGRFYEMCEHPRARPPRTSST